MGVIRYAGFAIRIADTNVRRVWISSS